jgi:acetylserotonin O-methyltransferase
MADDLTPADPSVVLDLMEAFRRSKTMFAAVSIGVFDELADGPQTLSTLTASLAANEDALGRLLDACVCLQLLERQGDAYANTPAAAAFLCQQSPQRLTGYINFSNTVMWQLWSHLEDAVREGTHRWQQTYGWDGPIFASFFKTEESLHEFLMGMNGYGLISSPHVVGAFNLSGYHRLVDLGGATGHLAIEACRRYSHLQATVFDLPDAMPLARTTIDGSGVADRIELVPGDFFQDELPEGDLYALGRILHDWNEEKIICLLEKIYARLPEGGALLIAEKLITEERDGPRWALMQSLNMLTCTEGKERTLTEYENLLKLVGFSQVSGCRTSSPLDATLAIK